MKPDEEDEEGTPVKKERAPRKARAGVKKEESESEVKAEGESDASCSSTAIPSCAAGGARTGNVPDMFSGDMTRLSAMRMMAIASSFAGVLL